jgi:hypothetical protein
MSNKQIKYIPTSRKVYTVHKLLHYVPANICGYFMVYKLCNNLDWSLPAVFSDQ